MRYTFEELGLTKITADVDIVNVASAKILDKIMLPVKEFYNDEDRSVDRRYEISKEQWLSKVGLDVWGCSGKLLRMNYSILFKYGFIVKFTFF